MSRLDDLLRAAEDLLRDIRSGATTNAEVRGYQLIREMERIVNDASNRAKSKVDEAITSISYLIGEVQAALSSGEF